MLLLLDGNNLAWAGYYGLERAMHPDGAERKQRVALLGLASMALGAIARAGEPPMGLAADAASRPSTLTRVAICFDEGRPLRRRELFPAYQTGREGDPKFMDNEPTILAAIDEFCALCKQALPFDVLRGKNTEADDLIAGVVHHNPKLDKRIVSTDRDFLQLVSASTTIYSPVKKVVIGEDNFDEAAMPRASSGQTVAFPRKRFLDYRALTGDASDNLPGVPGFGPLSAAKLLGRGPLESYFGDPAAVRSALGRKSALAEAAFADGAAAAIVARNRTLMDLRLAAPCWEDLPSYTTTGRYDRHVLEGWLDQQKVTSIDRTQLIARIEALS
jgi:DNA polymerase I